MALIDNTYFEEDINLTGQQLNNLNDWIIVYEDQIRKKLLGYELNKALEDDLDANGEPQTQKFIDLVNGVEFSFEYESHTINTKWEGLRGVNKKSLIAYYVYYQYRNYNETFTTTVGEKRTSGENAENANPEYKLINAWNKMVDLYGYFTHEYFNPFYEDLFLDNSNYEHINRHPSAYNYLLANISDFGNWVFEPIEKQNIFHI